MVLGIRENRYTNYERGERTIPAEVLFAVEKVTGAGAKFILWNDINDLRLETYRALFGNPGQTMSAS